MEIYPWIVENKELFKLLYALVIVFICAVIVIKTHRLFKISLHTGIRYFRNAFFFYGIGFAIRFFLGSPDIMGSFHRDVFPTINFLFEFFLIMAGFFIVYSLVWKRFEKEGPHSSLFNTKITMFYLMAIIIALVDFLWTTHMFMFLSQIILFAFASIICLIRFNQRRKGQKFLKFYFIAMLLTFLAWVLNFLADIYFDWNQMVLINTYILNLAVFFIFLSGVARIAR